MLVGDVILAIDETSAVGPTISPAYLSADRVGQRAALRVLRGASPVQLDVTIGERTERADWGQTPGDPCIERPIARQP